MLRRKKLVDAVLLAVLAVTVCGCGGFSEREEALRAQAREADRARAEAARLEALLQQHAPMALHGLGMHKLRPVETRFEDWEYPRQKFTHGQSKAIEESVTPKDGPRYT